MLATERSVPQGKPADHQPLNADAPAAAVATYPAFAYGYTGVGLFFVLSGFCIHLPQARRFHKSGDDRLDSPVCTSDGHLHRDLHGDAGE